MERKDFLRGLGVFSVGTIVAIPTILSSSSCSKENEENSLSNSDSCTTSPSETKGPFPIMTPSQLVQANIKSDRTGVALLITLTIENKTKNCNAFEGALVDIWHCDKDGNYSEYGGTQMQQTDYTAVHFLRGRQTTDVNGNTSFITIYPGWYNGRAPHIHIEVSSSTGTSLLVTQIAFPENISTTVYASTLYSEHGQADTKNENDNVFSDSLSSEVATVIGDTINGYTLTKTIVVNG